jgi:site-specific DNA recombinase
MVKTKTKKNVSIIPGKMEHGKKVDAEQKILRVAAYCRVSTQLEQQESSFEAQKNYYTEKITNNPNWKLAGIYADDGISGTDMKKRDEFNRLLQDCEAGKIDMILTKSISRFARNTVDTLNTLRILRKKGVTVFFEKEHIDTHADNGEMIITVLSGLAQEESFNLSENTRWGIIRKFENGTIMLNHNRFMGYTKGKDGELAIVPEEAETVRLIFRMYLEGTSIAGIKRHLEKEGILTVTGRKIWNEGTISKMLSNEKYMGDALLQKSYTADFLTKTRKKNNGEMRQYYITDNHEGIVAKEIYYAVQREKQRRAERRKPAVTRRTKEKKKGYSSKYILSNLLVCGECGQPYRRITWTRNGVKRIVWRCSNRVEHGTEYCKNSPTLDEEALQRAVMRTVSNVVRDSEFGSVMQNNVILVIGQYADSIQSENNEIDEKIAGLEREMLQMVKETPDFNDGAFLEKYRTLGGEIQKLKQKKISEANVRKLPVPSEIREKIKSMDRNEIAFDPVLVGQLIEKIIARNARRIEVVFKSGLVENGFLETED